MKFYFTRFGDRQFFELTGNTSRLANFIHREAILEGRVDGYTDSWPNFRVVRIQQIFETPSPQIAESFADSSQWQHESNKEYGIKFAHPLDWTAADLDASVARPNFASDQGAITVAAFAIPRALYPGSNLVAGGFAIYANPSITNARSCAQFADSDSRLRSARNVAGIDYSTYTVMGGAMSTDYTHRDFHSFQNGICYQISFGFAAWNTSVDDLGCTTPVITQADQERVVEPVLGAVSFFGPAFALGKQETSASDTPRILQFKASFDDSPATMFTFSWQTKNADYVQLSYVCSPAPNGTGVVVLEHGLPRECANTKLNLYPGGVPNRSPNSKLSVVFGNYLQPQPISIAVTLTPFSHATPYPAAAKSITIQVPAEKRTTPIGSGGRQRP